MYEKKKKYDPMREDPEDTVGTIYCGENSVEFNNIMSKEDVFPYQPPLPKYRRTPEPPII